MAVSGRVINRRLKPLLFLLLSLPALWLAWQWGQAILGGAHALGANPIEYTNRFLGDWALRYVVGGLALSPLAHATGSKLPIHFRRMVGLFAFSYVMMHVTSYVVLDQFFDWAEIGKDIAKRNFITVGMLSLLLLTPLAVTSTNRMVKRLGARRWKRLHKLIYLIGPLTVLHYNLMIRGNQAEPKYWAAGLIFLLLYRVGVWFAGRRRGSPPRKAVVEEK